MCPPDQGYSFGTATHIYTDTTSSVEGTTNETLSITLTKGAQLATTVGGSITTTEGVFIASAQEQVSTSIQQTVTEDVTKGAQWTVPSTWSVGYLHAGGDRYSTPWTYGSYNGSCQWIVQRSGTGKLAYHEPAFWHNKQASGGPNQN